MSTHFEYDISGTNPDPDWDKFVATVPGGRHFQTSLWMQVKKASGWRSLLIRLFENGTIIGGTHLLIRQYPIIGAVAYVSRGPLLAKHETCIHDIFLAALLEVTETERIQFLLIQPSCSGDPIIPKLLDSGFQLTTRIRVAPIATMLVDLTRDFDVIESSMHKRTQRYIRSALNKGITVEEGSPHDIDIYFQLLQEKAHRKGWSIFHYEYYKKMWQILSPHNNVRLTFARYEGKTIGALLVYAFGEGIYGKTNITIPEYANSGASELLLHEAFQWGKQQGYQYFELAIVDPEVARKIESGELTLSNVSSRLELFKYRMGGHPVFCPSAYIYLKNPLLNYLYRTVFSHLVDSEIGSRIRKRIRGLSIIFRNRSRT